MRFPDRFFSSRLIQAKTTHPLKDARNIAGFGLFRKPARRSRLASFRLGRRKRGVLENVPNPRQKKPGAWSTSPPTPTPPWPRSSTSPSVPQLSSRRPSAESSVCETTGKHIIGHVHLGARHPRVVVGGDDLVEGVSGAATTSPRRPGEEDLEEEEDNRSMGEPQLTTCTDR